MFVHSYNKSTRAIKINFLPKTKMSIITNGLFLDSQVKTKLEHASIKAILNLLRLIP